MAREDTKRWVVDWTKFLGDIEDITKEWELEEQEGWYKDLEEDTAYKKMISLTTKYLKESNISSRSKKWWTTDLGNQLKVVRGCARGGKGEREGEADYAR